MPWVPVPALSWEALLFLNLPRLDERHSELCVCTFKKISKGGYSLNIFRSKTRVYVHHHYTRNTENYITKAKCRTERLLRCFVPNTILTLNSRVCIDHIAACMTFFFFGWSSRIFDNVIAKWSFWVRQFFRPKFVSQRSRIITIAFFLFSSFPSPRPFSFPFLSLLWFWSFSVGLKKPAFWHLFTQMTANFVRLFFKKSELDIYIKTKHYVRA